MPEFAWFIVMVLAGWRLTNILLRERIARPIRHWMGERIDQGTGMESYPDSFFGYLLNCFWCSSVWMGALVTIIYLLLPELLLPFAVSAAAILINNWMEKDDGVQKVLGQASPSHRTGAGDDPGGILG